MKDKAKFFHQLSNMNKGELFDLSLILAGMLDNYIQEDVLMDETGYILPAEDQEPKLAAILLKLGYYK